MGRSFGNNCYFSHRPLPDSLFIFEIFCWIFPGLHCEYVVEFVEEKKDGENLLVYACLWPPGSSHSHTSSLLVFNSSLNSQRNWILSVYMVSDDFCSRLNKKFLYPVFSVRGCISPVFCLLFALKPQFPNRFKKSHLFALCLPLQLLL